MTEKKTDENASCQQVPHNDDALRSTLSQITHTIMILSGKGGVGKSAVAVSLATLLAARGHAVGLLDIDFHGPSVPTMLGVHEKRLQATDAVLYPIEMGTLKIVSLGLILDQRSDAVIWRGPMKAGVIRQLLENVAWGALDYLIMDFPPGTGDEALSACQLVTDADGGIIVTTPQEVSLSDCRRCISFCRKLALPVIGVVENMNGFVCPHCGTTSNIFSTGGGKAMAEQEAVPYLGSIPLDPAFMHACDDGRVFADGDVHESVQRLFSDMVDVFYKQNNNKKGA